MAEWAVMLLDDDGAARFPDDLPGLAEVDMWSLRVAGWDVPADELDDWSMFPVATDVTVAEALDLARDLGLAGTPVGGRVAL